MIYNLKAINKDGHEEVFKFDQATGELMSEKGDLLFSGSSVRQKINPISPDNPGKKSSEGIKTLKIQLGLKCNYACSYCTQTIHIPEGKDTYVKDAEEFISRLDEWMTSTPDRVEFWGGEPLVYWKKLKVLIPALRSRWPEADFLMISNGSLFNDEVVDFILENNISTAISHDGPGQHLRSDDPLSKPEVVKAVERLVAEHQGMFSFNAVISGENANLEETVGYFKSRFGEDCHVSFEGILSYYNQDIIKKVRLTDDDLMKISDEIFYGIVGGTLEGSSLDQRADGVARYLLNPFNIDSMPSKCGMDTEEKMTVDLLGNVMTCQNTGPSNEHYAGSVYDIENVAVTSSKHWLFRRNCSTCPVFSACGGGCMFQEGQDFEESCRADYHQAYGIFRAAIYNLTGYVVTEISVHDKKDPNLIAISN